MIKNTIIKRISAAVLAALLIASGPATVFAAQDEAIEDNPEEIIAPDPETGYIDVHRDDWFCDAVFWAVEHNVASGTREYCFSPEMTITRAQAVTMFWNYRGRPQVQNSSGRFSDVAEGSWYENAVSWAVDANVAAGTGSGTFSPDKQCSRAEFITLLWAYCGAMYTNGLSDFDDVPNGAYYRQAAVWAERFGVLDNVVKDKFEPNRPCSRAEAASFIMNASIRPEYPRPFELTEAGLMYIHNGIPVTNDWVGKDGWWYHMNEEGFCDEKTLTGPSLTCIEGYYIHPMYANKYNTPKERIEAMIAAAYEYIGDPYVVFKSREPGPGVDCSGLAMQALYAAGFDPAPATPLRHATEEYTSRTLYSLTPNMIPVDLKDIQRGDLVYYVNKPSSKTIIHVAIYLGNGYVIESWPNKVTDKYKLAGKPHQYIYAVERPDWTK